MIDKSLEKYFYQKEGESDDGFEDDFLEEKEDPTFEVRVFFII